MEFWGVEVKAGKSLKCDPGAGKFTHISQAVVEVKNDKANNVVLSVMIGGKKLVIGILTQKTTHILFDLVFEKEFELSHNGKSSVHVCGYTCFIKKGLDEFNDESEDDSDVVPELIPPAKSNAATIKQKVNASKNEPKPMAEGKPSYVEAEGSDDDDESEDLSDSDKDMNSLSDDTDDCEDESSEEEKTTVNVNKKRSASSASKTPVPEKKAKLVTPAGQKSGTEKKFVHTATPHPIKQAGKTPAASKSHQPIPNTGTQLSCKFCNKAFTSDHALESRTKAKHSSGK